MTVLSAAATICMGISLLATCVPARACVGVNLICDAGKSLAGGASEKFQPIVIDVMEREAPELILKLQAAVDHGILSFEAAVDRLVPVMLAAAKEAEDHAFTKIEELVPFVKGQLLDVEQTLVNDLGKLLDSAFDKIGCAAAGLNNDLAQQQKDLLSRIKDILNPLHNLVHSKVDKLCRKEAAINLTIRLEDAGALSQFKYWRCSRLQQVDENHASSDIAAAYENVTVEAYGMLCAWRKAGTAANAELTELWNDADWRAKVWRRAEKGGL